MPTTDQSGDNSAATDVISETLEDALGPFPSYSAFQLCSWYWLPQSGTLSNGHFQELTRSVFMDPMFRQEDVNNLDTNKLRNLVASYNPILQSHPIIFESGMEGE